MTTRASRFLFWTSVLVVEAVAVWLVIDAGKWVSGHERYTIFFERLFDTPASEATQMRWIQGVSACLFGCVFMAGLLSLQRRASQRDISDEKDGG